MNNFNLNLLKYFYYVAYYKGFTNAAKNLNSVQSALSYNVKTLESLMNKSLINRNSKVFQLTDDGLDLYEILKNIFGILENNIQYFNNNDEYKEIYIGVRHYLSDFIFKDSLKKIIDVSSNIHLNISFYSKLELKNIKGKFDIIIDYDDYIDLVDKYNKVFLCNLDNAIVCGKELYKSFNNVKSIKELDNCDLISMNPNKKNGKFQKLCFENQMLFKNVLSINDGQLFKKLIMDNIGLSFVNNEFVKNEIAIGNIFKLNISQELFKDKIIIAYKENIIVEKIVKILVEEWREYIND
ncbi:MAG: LysR family transcriptional regulator [Bacilli bacterium]